MSAGLRLGLLNGLDLRNLVHCDAIINADRAEPNALGDAWQRRLKAVNASEKIGLLFPA